MNVVARLKAPTPKFFKVLQLVGLGLASAGATIIAKPVDVPAAVVDVAKCLATAGSVMALVCQTAVHQEPGAGDVGPYEEYEGYEP
jgi:hypothetical protein